MKHFDPKEQFQNRSLGLMSAERGHLSTEENDIRTAQLHRDLRKTGFHITPVKGGYVENYGKSNAHETEGENSFLVMHPFSGNDHGELKNALIRLGKKYDQDSILHKPHDSHMAHFHGTNKTGWPGMDQKANAGYLGPRKGAFYTKLPSGHEFSFHESYVFSYFAELLS